MAKLESNGSRGASEPCPCGSGRALAVCCGPYLDASALPPTAEATMRSRYSAFATGNSEHLYRTWHPRTRPTGPIDTGDGWLGLTIVEVVDGTELDSTGVVQFVAHNATGDMRERSRFEKRGGRWLYLDANG